MTDGLDKKLELDQLARPTGKNFDVKGNPEYTDAIELIDDEWFVGTAGSATGFQSLPNLTIQQPTTPEEDEWIFGEAQNYSGFRSAPTALLEGPQAVNSNTFGLQKPQEPDKFKILDFGHGMSGQKVRYSRARDPRGCSAMNCYLCIGALKPICKEDIEQDETFVRKYLPECPQSNVISPIMRAAAVDWMTGMQVLFDADIRALHVATQILDGYTWLNNEIKPRDYLKVVVASFITAAKMTTKGCDEAEVVVGVHEFCKDLFTLKELKEAVALLECEFAHEGFKKLIPHYYLPYCLKLMPKFHRDIWEKFVALCLYLLDLGALNIGLVKYSARTKCGGMICCAREAFRKFCECSNEEKHNPKTRCPYHKMSPMSVEIQEALQINYDDHVKNAAQIYRKMLSQAKKIAQSPIPSHVKNCSEPFMAAYNKFKSDAYFKIAKVNKLPSMEED
ncbi:hypothetical protein Aperf_G00000046544 [Anoplocephala perfoliata]